MLSRVSPFLMFAGDAEQAIELYTSLLPDSRVERVDRYGPGDPGPEGSVKRAELSLWGNRVLCIDSPVPQEFGFTPAFSLFVDCESAAQVDILHDGLAPGGRVLMPPDDYGFSPRFTWIEDRFGVSWQLSAPA